MLVPGSVNPLLLTSAAGAAAGGISRSLRFNSPDSAYLSRTPGSAGNRRTWTWAGWVKRASPTSGERILFQAGSTSISSGSSRIVFVDDQLDVRIDGNNSGRRLSTAVFRDFSAWYHILVSVDTTQSTATNRIKVYVNGVEQTVFSTSSDASQNFDTAVNATERHLLGVGANSGGGIDSGFTNGCLADCYLIDGSALTPSSFTETDATTGQLIPKAYTGSYGTNGFHLEFSDNSGTTSTTLGKDSAGSNNWTPNNFSVSSGAGNDSLVDVPTSSGTDSGLGGEVRGNYATFNPTEATTSGTRTLTNGNLDALLADANAARLTIPPVQASGKYQWEITVGSKTATYYQMGLNLISMVYATGDLHATFRSDGNLSNTLSGSWSGTGVSYTSGDVITVTYDNSNNSCAFYKNGVYSATFTLSGTPQVSLNFGVFYGGSGNTNYTLNAGQRAFAYPVSGFKALCTANLPAPGVTKPSTVMDVVLYTGTGSALTPTSTLGFNPDLVWIKGRSGATDHAWYDSVRGVEKRLESNNTDAEVTSDGGVTAFNSAGFSVGTLAQVNTSSATYAGWCWDAGTTTDTNNTAGTITPTGVRANATAGFSVVTYTGNGSSSQTIGHGLGAAPAMVIVKRRDSATNWNIWFTGFTSNEYILLNTTGAKATFSGQWGSTPTSTVFGVGSDGSVNASGSTYVAYCFAPVVGYSSFGGYTGNGSSDGPFVFCGFRPKWILTKRYDGGANGWGMFDTSRPGYNLTDSFLQAQSSGSESTGATAYSIDILSNGFKVRGTDAFINQSGGSYIFAAFAESPFNYARAR